MTGVCELPAGVVLTDLHLSEDFNPDVRTWFVLPVLTGPIEAGVSGTQTGFIFSELP